MQLSKIILENYTKNSNLYQKITYIQDLLDSGNVSEAKVELEYIRQELHRINK